MTEVASLLPQPITVKNMIIRKLNKIEVETFPIFTLKSPFIENETKIVVSYGLSMPSINQWKYQGVRTKSN
jgi:hypothetical protein